MVHFIDVLKANDRPFGEQVLQGEFIKCVIRQILDESGYISFPYGYESYLTFIKRVLQKESKPSLSPISRRVRSAPDLVVYDPDPTKVWMVEVKSKNWDRADSLDSWSNLKINRYKEYWPESTLVLAIPSKHWFYAQQADKISLPQEKGGVLDLTKEFKPFEEVFERVSVGTLYGYKRIVAGVFGIFGSSREGAWCFPEDFYEDWDHNRELLSFAKKRETLSEDELFRAYGKENLMSRERFDENMKVLKEKGLL